MAHFFWPGIGQDVKQYCQLYDACQKVYPKECVKKVPLGKVPVVDEPFRRVAVDIVGPIEPRSDKGNA